MFRWNVDDDALITWITANYSCKWIGHEWCQMLLFILRLFASQMKFKDSWILRNKQKNVKLGNKIRTSFIVFGILKHDWLSFKKIDILSKVFEYYKSCFHQKDQRLHFFTDPLKIPQNFELLIYNFTHNFWRMHI